MASAPSSRADTLAVLPLASYREAAAALDTTAAEAGIAMAGLAGLVAALHGLPSQLSAKSPHHRPAHLKRNSLVPMQLRLARLMLLHSQVVRLEHSLPKFLVVEPQAAALEAVGQAWTPLLQLVAEEWGLWVQQEWPHCLPQAPWWLHPHPSRAFALVFRIAKGHLHPLCWSLEPGRFLLLLRQAVPMSPCLQKHRQGPRSLLGESARQHLHRPYLLQPLARWT
mmetsp:Transcript_56603/g.132813  ORF Transcript_56603/g.132813 Transcript_56603/m.132813 type:complete len:224 (+) Transcript_56603:516-1187(+)